MRGSPAKAKRPETVAEYLATAPKDKRAALTKVRKAIRAAAPKATEGISYGIVGFKQNGKPLIFLGHAKDHCALYGSFDRRDPELKAYDLSKGTIRFPADRPPSDRFVRKMVRARLAEIDRPRRGERRVDG